MPALSTPPPHRDTPPLPAAPSPSALTPSPNPAPPPDSWGWTPTQRRALATLLALLLIFLVIETLHRPARLSAPQSDTHPLHLPPLLDPNTASEADLAMLPHVGQKLAAAIITYRTTHQPLTPDHPLFQTPQDL
ncbi:MAG TPA: helix-hairpin-helix domain-containing protein, partial [Phycisphaerae bacterium]|nr:helix-hairpin-helix domain-containing protein [Phycisphaerae bacterium]